MNRTRSPILYAFLALFLTSSPARPAAAKSCRAHACVFSIAVGKESRTEAQNMLVLWRGKTADEPALIKLSSTFWMGQSIEVPSGSNTTIVLITRNGNKLTLSPGCRVRIDEVGNSGERFAQLKGFIGYAIASGLDFFHVLHDTILASVKGTEFTVAIDEQQQKIDYGWVHGEVVVEHEVTVAIEGGKGGGREAEGDEGDEAVTYTEREVLSKSRPALSYRLGPGQYIKTFKSYAAAETYFRAQLAKDEASEQAARIQRGLTDLGAILNAMGKRKEALEVLARALDLATENGNQAQEGRVARQLGITYRAVPDYPKSAEMLRRWLAIEERRGGPGSIAVAHAYTALGRTEGASGDPRAWVKHVERALDIHRQLDPEERRLSTAQAYKNLGDAWRAAGDPAKAAQCYRTSLATKRKLKPGGMTRPIANSLRDLGLLHVQIGEHATGIDYLQQALAGRVKLFGDVHPQVANVYEDLGSALAAAGDPAKALESYRKAQDLRLQLFSGGEHASVVRTFRAMARVARQAGDEQAAADYQARAKAIAEKIKVSQ